MATQGSLRVVDLWPKMIEFIPCIWWARIMTTSKFIRAGVAHLCSQQAATLLRARRFPNELAKMALEIFCSERVRLAKRDFVYARDLRAEQSLMRIRRRRRQRARGWLIEQVSDDEAEQIVVVRSLIHEHLQTHSLPHNYMARESVFPWDDLPL